MTDRWLREAVAACRLPLPLAFPRNLAAEAQKALPVSLVPLAGLTSDGVRDWLAQRGVRHRVAETNRRLHGCLVAQGGGGALLYDSEDSEAEQRFTLAHEVAHFVLDHLQPRSRALRVFGDKILPVLNGRCRPTPEESLSSVLDRIPIGVRVKLMGRGVSGSIGTGKVAEAEHRADRLALELLAPEERALAVLKDVSADGAEALVAAHFGLPVHVAREYVRRLLRPERTPPFSIRRFLGEETG